MNNQNYLIESEKTEKKFPDGLKVQQGTLEGTIGLFESVMHMGFLVDVLKKHFIYDKSMDEMGDLVEKHLSNLAKAQARMDQDDGELIELDQDRAEVFHALLGLVSELSEVIEIVVPYLQGKEMDANHLSEEIADAHWYYSILNRKFNINPDESLSANIAKLKARYPDKFSSDNALNRNLDAEQIAMGS